jgi:RibD C-terminal domain
MSKLIYSAITSLDGYVADADGKFDWGEPDEEVHSFFNDLERPVGTYLYGRRLYEVMVAWDDAEAFAGQPPYIQDFARLWQAADTVVYSRTLDVVSSARTRIKREFDPETVRRMKAAAERDLTGRRSRTRGPRVPHEDVRNVSPGEPSDPTPPRPPRRAPARPHRAAAGARSPS